MQSPIKMNFRHPELENPALTHINRLPARSNLIPAQKSGVYFKNKEDSSLLQLLSGDFRFRYCQEDCIADFYLSDYDDSQWDVIDVPSMWQFRGYGACAYPNSFYPFPVNPPFVSGPNPVGYYRRTFTAAPGEKTILHFGGVENAFYVYLNGAFVGFSKGSRIPAEFDVSDRIKPGKNVLAVKVFTYSDATYLECQDMIMANGIFRDVYLLHTDSVSLWDFRVTTDLQGFRIRLELNDFCPDYEVDIQIGEECRSFPSALTVDTYFPIENPRLWNSEEPNLYELEIRIRKAGEIREIHSKKIGMMHSRIQGNCMLVNGKPIYLKGINRHEFDCDNGRAISVELIEKELKLIKANNINAIRCSHYTNHPAFYEICSELGLFVMDEVDLETHGCGAMGDQGYISKRKEWLPAYLDRTERMIKQNKNEACIFMYSIGNECGRGENLLACQKYVLDYEPDKIVIHDQKTDFSLLTQQSNGPYDFIQRFGYYSAKQLQAVIDAQPICMQIEYCHGMGNSPGFLEGYQRFVYETDKYIGGFVWEFKNHGFHQVDEQGNDYYLYGGDFGERFHYANYCLDGYLMSDGTPKHSWYELGEVFAPVYVTYDGKIHLKNTYSFRNLDALTLKWELCEDYHVIKCGQMQLPSVEPHAETILDLNVEPDHYRPGAAYYLNLHFYDGNVCTGSHQIELPVHTDKQAYAVAPFSGCISTDGRTICISGENFEVRFEKGILNYYKLGETALLDKPISFNLYRAPLDNDGVMIMKNMSYHRYAGEWNFACMDTVDFSFYEVTCEQLQDMVICKAKGKAAPIVKYYGFDIEMEYRVFNDGLISVDMKAYPYGKFTETLPRIGLCVPLSKEYGQVIWYGRGERENYSDCKKASPIGFYCKPIEETYTIFDKPQESGNHENTSFVMLSNVYGNGLTVVGCDQFAFSYHDFSLSSLTKARHKNEIVKSDLNYLYVDYKMRGLGNNSCGPNPEEEFELIPHAFEFAFVLAGNLTQEQALELTRTDFGIHTRPLDELRTDSIITEYTDEVLV